MSVIPRVYSPDEIDATRDAVTAALLAAGHRQRGATIRFPCPAPTHADAHASTDWHVERGAWVCRSRGCQEHYGGGTIALAGLLGVIVGAELSPETVAAAEQAHAVAAAELARTEADHAAALDRLCTAQYDRDCADRLYCDDDAMAALGRRGISRACAAVHLIGLDPAARVRGGSWRALVWPWMTGYQPISFQIRNLAADGGKDDRYRWHGLIGNNGARLYHNYATAPALFGDKPEPARGPLIVVEGFLKLATLWSAGWTNVAALYHAGSLDAATVDRLAVTGEDVILAPDPDARDSMAERARSIPGARVATLPAKPDDLVIESGAATLRRYLGQARTA